jgi:hypothetical protein
MQKKDRLKPLSLYGLNLKEALHAMLSVDPRKLRLKEETTEEPDEVRRSNVLRGNEK